MANHLRERSFRILFGLTKQETQRNTFILLKADDEGNIIDDGFSDYGFTYQRKDKHFTDEQQEKVQNFLRINLPEVIYQSINWDEILTDDKTQNKARVYYRILFNRETILHILDRPKK